MVQISINYNQSKKFFDLVLSIPLIGVLLIESYLENLNCHILKGVVSPKICFKFCFASAEWGHCSLVHCTGLVWHHYTWLGLKHSHSSGRWRAPCTVPSYLDFLFFSIQLLDSCNFGLWTIFWLLISFHESAETLIYTLSGVFLEIGHL